MGPKDDEPTAGPYDAESTIREQQVYRIDYEMGDDEGEAETRQHVAASAPPPPPTTRPSPLATTTGMAQQSPFARSINVERDFEIDVEVESEKPERPKKTSGTLPLLTPPRR